MVDREHAPVVDRIGPYRIEHTLGTGGMGEVVQAYDERLDRRVAIKRIRRREVGRDETSAATERARLRREARAVARLSHPSIVQIHDLVEDESGDALVMELVDGCTLAQTLRSAPLPIDDVLRLGQQIANGLGAAHERGLIHRDLKTENVMVTPEGDAKILDFGLAKQHHAARADDPTLTQGGALLGTVRAMSPEQAAGSPIDHRSDLFSLGTLLYEMITGQSPFLGDNALETLRRIQAEVPTPIASLRPETPPGLIALVGDLLRKDPDRRLADAEAVARRLAALSPSDDTTRKEPRRRLGKSLGDLQTGSLTPPPPAAVEQGPPAGRRARIAVSIIAAIVIAALAVGWLARSPDAVPLRVAVPAPSLDSAATETLGFVATGAHIAILAALADLGGISPVEPSELDASMGTPIEVARAVAADEIVMADVAPQEGGARVSLRRIDASDGTVIWAGRLDVPLDAGGTRLLTEAVAIQLRKAYPNRDIREGTPRLEAHDDDLATFVDVVRQLADGSAPTEPQLTRLEAIVASSPRFLTARLRAAVVALSRYSDRREPADLERAAAHAQAARDLAPDEPQAFQLLLRIALARGEPAQAADILETLDQIAPNSVETLMARVRVARAEGDLDRAAELLGRVVERRPSWNHLYLLGDVEFRRGHVEAARRHLEALLVRAPRSTWGLGKLVQLELLHGDLEQAERLARRAIAIRPHRSYYANLGLAQYYRGDYLGARESYGDALRLDPEHLTVRLNLADADLALGDQDAAMNGYRRILDRLDAIEDRALRPTERMTMAQCLAHLGEAQRAAAVTLETLQKHADHAEVAYQAALVYALVGEPASALVNVERALERGFQPRQFAIPVFAPLRDDPRFQALIATGG